MILVAVVLAGVLVALYVQNQSLRDQATRSDESTQTILENQKKTIDEQRKQIETTNRYIQCIAQFFATTDRTTRVLTDLENCNITSNGTPVTGLNLTPKQNSTVPNTGNSSGNTGQNNPGNSGGTGGDGGNGSGNNNGGDQSTSKPVKVLGIPLCVPILNVCVEQ